MCSFPISLYTIPTAIFALFLNCAAKYNVIVLDFLIFCLMFCFSHCPPLPPHPLPQCSLWNFLRSLCLYVVLTNEQQKATVKTLDAAKPKHAKVTAAPKYEELPEIPDYERPPLEKFEKPEFTKVSIHMEN